MANGGGVANVGGVDRVLRLALGVALVLAGLVPALASVFAGWGISSLFLIIAGVAVFASGVFRFCFAYKLFGLSTCAIKKA